MCLIADEEGMNEEGVKTFQYYAIGSDDFLAVTVTAQESVRPIT